VINVLDLLIMKYKALSVLQKKKSLNSASTQWYVWRMTYQFCSYYQSINLFLYLTVDGCVTKPLPVFIKAVTLYIFFLCIEGALFW